MNPADAAYLIRDIEAQDAERRRRAASAYDNANFANTPEGKQLAFAQEMQRQQIANQQSMFGQLIGVTGGGAGGGGTTSSGYLGLSDAEKRLSSLLDDPDSIKQSGAYKFRVGQGQEALERSLGAKGLLGSGNRLTELTKYGQDMGSQEYDNQFGRLANLLGNYQTSADRRYATNMGTLGGLVNGGDSSNYWNAYTNPRTAGVSGSYGQAAAQIAGNAQQGAARSQAEGVTNAASLAAQADMYKSMWGGRQGSASSKSAGG